MNLPISHSKTFMQECGLWRILYVCLFLERKALQSTVSSQTPRCAIVCAGTSWLSSRLIIRTRCWRMCTITWVFPTDFCKKGAIRMSLRKMVQMYPFNTGYYAQDVWLPGVSGHAKMKDFIVQVQTAVSKLQRQSVAKGWERGDTPPSGPQRWGYPLGDSFHGEHEQCPYGTCGNREELSRDLALQIKNIWLCLL